MRITKAKIMLAGALAACTAIPGMAAPTLAVAVQGEGAVNFYSALAGGVLLLPAGSVHVGKRSGELCLSRDQKQLFVSTDKDVAIVDVGTKSVVGNLTAPGLGAPDGCDLSADGKKLYVISPESNSLFIFDTQSKQFLKKIDVQKEPRRVIVTPDGQKALVANSGSNTLSVLDTSNDTITGEVKTGIEPRDMTFSPDGKLLAVTLIDNDSIGFFDGHTFDFKWQIGAVRSPQHFGFSPDSSRLYVVGKISNQLGIVGISPVKARTLDILQTDQGPLGLLGDWGFAMSPNGLFTYVSNLSEGTVAIIDVTLNKQVRTIYAGKTPGAMIMIKDTNAINTMSDSAKLDHFRTLAKQAMDATKAKDYAKGAKLAGTLEQEWDEGSGNIKKKSPELWGEIDESMDDFIHPIMHSNTNPPDPAALNNAYETFIANLNKAR